MYSKHSTTCFVESSMHLVNMHTSKLVDGTFDNPLASGATHPDLKLDGLASKEKIKLLKHSYDY